MYVRKHPLSNSILKVKSLKFSTKNARPVTNYKINLHHLHLLVGANKSQHKRLRLKRRPKFGRTSKWVSKKSRKNLFLWWDKSFTKVVNKKSWKPNAMKKYVTRRAHLHLTKVRRFMCKLTSFPTFKKITKHQSERRVTKSQKTRNNRLVPVRYTNFLRSFHNVNYRLFFKRKNSITSPVVSSGKKLLDKRASHVSYKKFFRSEEFREQYKFKRKILKVRKKMAWYKNKKIKAPYVVVLKNKLRKRRIIPKTIKHSLKLNNSLVKKRLRRLSVRRRRLRKRIAKYIKSVYPKIPTTKMLYSMSHKTPLTLPRKTYFFGRKRLTSAIFLVKHGITLPLKSVSKLKKFRRKGPLSKKSLKRVEWLSRKVLKEKETDLVSENSKTYKLLTPSQIFEYKNLSWGVANSGKFTLHTKNNNLLGVLELSNANLFFSTLKDSLRLALPTKKSTKNLFLMKSHKKSWLARNSLRHYKSNLFHKAVILSSTHIRKNVLFKKFFGSELTSKKYNQTRSASLENENDVLLKFNWKIKQMRVVGILPSSEQVNNLNLLKFNHIIQALVIPEELRFIKLKSAFYNYNQELLSLVNTASSKIQGFKPCSVPLLVFGTVKVSILNAIFAKNNYQNLNSRLVTGGVTLFSQTPGFSLPITPPIKGSKCLKNYEILVNFLNDFSLAKTTARVNVLAKTSWAVSIPGTVSSTNALNRNHLSKHTFYPNTNNIVTKSMSLLFYRKKIPNYKKLLFLSHQNTVVGNFSQDNGLRNFCDNGAEAVQLSVSVPYAFNPTPFIVSRSHSLRSSLPRSGVVLRKKKKRSSRRKLSPQAYELVKPVLKFKLRKLRKFIYKRKFRRVSNRLLSFKQVLGVKNVSKKWNKFKKRSFTPHYVRRAKSVSYCLTRRPVGKTPSVFYNKYSSIFAKKFAKRQKTCLFTQSKTPQLTKTTRFRVRRSWGGRFFRKTRRVLRSKMKKRVRWGIKKHRSKGRPKKIKTRAVRALISSYKLTTLRSLAAIIKKTTVGVTAVSKNYVRDRLLTTRRILINEKKRVFALNRVLSYKKFVYKLFKYAKPRLAAELAHNFYSSYKSTKRYKVAKFSAKSSKLVTPIIASSNLKHSPLLTTPISGSGMKNFNSHSLINTDNFIAAFISSPFIIKLLSDGSRSFIKNSHFTITNLLYKDRREFALSNFLPAKCFKYSLSRKIYNSTKLQTIQENFTPWYYNTLVRFMEHCSGKKCLFQFYPFVNNDVEHEFFVRYKKWIPRMAYYERRLGHRFFLEEAIHIMHLSFSLKDPKLICSWLKAIILRISFWKTRSIFRFLKYLIHNYYRHTFADLGLKGLKIKLKGKISAAGNSRKRTILYRVGKTSHSQVSLRVVNEFMTINTFTGVMGFQIWLFY